MIEAIDLFSGLGGLTQGAEDAGVDVVYAANHWPEAVRWHSANHPHTMHACQDLRQARWADMPRHDLGLAAPCCQGHTRARGKGADNPEHDDSRSTAWAVVDCAESRKQEAWAIENVPEFMNWTLYPAWAQAMKALGYQLAPHIVDCADLGVPQHRIRMFMIATKSKAPIHLKLPQYQHVPASSFIDFDSGNWSSIEKPGRAASTLTRVANGRKKFGERFLMPYYGSGSGLTGRCIKRPIGTITTRDRWAVVDGNKMRMLTADEVLAAQTFPSSTLRPDSHRLTVHMAGNAVPPRAAKAIIQALKEAA
ncbi:DNA (cytosine-5)-methyltransferase 1 [Pseudomonas fluorescens]|uniref:DNA cytosine methyltransferase n=1 Tax=Pseudomonas fluorescens TaxID=294 RepID=UPI00209ED94D|nr:DNA cytosine methyltransferase [Pseudomonas fluorescens]MCP1487959.1 DNA (cytosine-5)-methyltransferase 1 [Pseudomonas fluorescens]